MSPLERKDNHAVVRQSSFDLTGREVLQPSTIRRNVLLFETPVPKVIDIPTQKEQRNLPHFNTNPTLEEICEIIQSTRPDWDNLTQALLQLPGSQDLQALHGRLAEVFVDQLLSDITSFDQFNGTVTNPLLEKAVTSDYSFARDTAQRLIAYNRADQTRFAEYDNLRVVEGLPTLFEVKVVGSNGRKELKEVLQENPREHFFTPLKQYFHTDTFGFVIITVPERIQSKSVNQASFRDDGGQIIGLNFCLDELKAQAARIDYQEGVVHPLPG